MSAKLGLTAGLIAALLATVRSPAEIDGKGAVGVASGDGEGNDGAVGVRSGDRADQRTVGAKLGHAERLIFDHRGDSLVRADVAIETLRTGYTALGRPATAHRGRPCSRRDRQHPWLGCHFEDRMHQCAARIENQGSEHRVERAGRRADLVARHTIDEQGCATRPISDQVVGIGRSVKHRPHAAIRKRGRRSGGAVLVLGRNAVGDVDEAANKDPTAVPNAIGLRVGDVS